MTDTQKLVKAALKQGWVQMPFGRRSHIKLKAPDGAMVVIPLTPSDRQRGYLNSRANLRRHGLVI